MKRFFVLLPLAACLLAAHARADHTVTMQLSDEQNSGRAIGSIVITESRYGVVFTPELSGLQPGVYGFHVHEKPSCAPAEKDGKMVPALSAGPHYDPAGSKKHGTPWGDGHLGDLPALAVSANGNAVNPVLAPRLKLADLKGRDAGRYSPNFTGWETVSKGTEALGTQREKVRWIDLVAARLALTMIADPAVCARIFDIADRDHQDKRTEYGGIVRINDTGAWEVVEIRPRQTGSDTRFEAPQELFDQGYTSLFHFHFHAQEFEGGAYAGPHVGDFGYAESSRANCLVFSFVKRDTVDVDYYRHGPLVIDLGTVKRP